MPSSAIPPEVKAEKADTNHIWLNGFVYRIRPTDEDKIKLANIVLAKLRDPTCTVPDPELPHTRYLYLCINAS